jgi:rubrerythrin
MDENALEVLEKAMQLEKDGLQFYRQAAERIGDEPVAAVFNKLANDESDHLDILESQYESLASHETWMVFQELYKEDEETDSKSTHVFDSEKLHHLIVDGMTPQQAVKVGIKIEKDSIKYYASHAKTCGDPSGVEMFKRLEEFEKEHLLELEKLLKKINN